METVLITGGTGMIGKSLCRGLLERGYQLIVLSRQLRDPGYGLRDAGSGIRDAGSSKIKYSYWNIKTGKIDSEIIAIADHIIHLAGTSVAEKRWNKERKQEILDSRVKSGKLIVDSLKNIPNRIKTVISISGIGYYGPERPGKINFYETDEPYDDFLARVCQQWEAVMQPVTNLGKRLVIFRTGVVLSNEGGALKEFLKPLKFGIAPILGSGKQVMSWIHVDDLVNLFITAIENENYSGVYNAVAPNPVISKELVKELAKAKNKFFIPIHIPAIVLRSVLGEMSVEVLKSATVSSKKARDTGFNFKFNKIRDALNDLMKK